MDGLKTVLKTTQDVVEYALRVNKRCRNDDDFLYLLVLNFMGCSTGMDMSNFLKTRSSLGYPPYESVRRARQKIQRKHPELRSSEDVQVYRAENEEVYRDFAKH